MLLPINVMPILYYTVLRIDGTLIQGDNYHTNVAVLTILCSIGIGHHIAYIL